ncbi:hypothetical protein [Dulcicalothrix desertica]|uniref:hypothetical protein n=1 Tax=Dulcicalothrix desertica TaxID=32056 RepID=UPI000F8F229F|nr:hypothetical protein [Dulcicalothrix desertica]TWH61854.1 hypothetical protein CAL7102_00531 [Dulcicalothrix desertica PCC 7102]
MVSSARLLISKLSHVQKQLETRKQEYPETTYVHLVHSLEGLINAIIKVNEQLSNTIIIDKKKNQYLETLKLIAINITNFGNKWNLTYLADASAVVGTDPNKDLSKLERKILSKIKGGTKMLARLDNPRETLEHKISLREEARVALDAVRRGEKVEEVQQTIEKEGKKAAKKDKGEIDVLTETEIIEVKGSASYGTATRPDITLIGQIEKYIQKIKKDAKVNPSLPPRKIVVHLTQGVSDDVRKWFIGKAAKSGVIIEIRTGQR